MKKNQEVIASLDPGKPPKTPVIPTGPQFMRPVHFDHDDHDDDDYLEDDSDSDDDDDENRSILVFRSAVRPVAIERRVIPPTFKLAQPAFALPTRKSVILPTGRPLPAPSGQLVVRGIGRPIISTSVHMESLPAGCLLSESLIACGNTRLTKMPIIKDAGVRSLFLAGEVRAVHLAHED